MSDIIFFLLPKDFRISEPPAQRGLRALPQLPTLCPQNHSLYVYYMGKPHCNGSVRRFAGMCLYSILLPYVLF